MMIGLMFPGMLLPMLVVLTLLGSVTVVQRGWTALMRASTAPMVG
jgi:hypothetical protein